MEEYLYHLLLNTVLIKAWYSPSKRRAMARRMARALVAQNKE